MQVQFNIYPLTAIICYLFFAGSLRAEYSAIDSLRLIYATTSNSDSLRAEAIYEAGQLLRYQKYNATKKLLNKGLSLTIPNTRQAAKIQQALYFLEMIKENRTVALQGFGESYAFFEGTGDTLYMAEVLSDYLAFYQSTDHTDSTIWYGERAIALYQTQLEQNFILVSKRMIDLHIKVALCLSYQKELVKAESHIKGA